MRGVAGITRATRYGLVDDYTARADGEICLLVQVETAEALRNIEAIAAVEGVDGIFIGPSDLAASMGHLGNADHPDVQAKIKQGLAAARKVGKPIGCLSLSAEGAAAQLKEGFAFSMLGTDLGFLVRQVRSDVAVLKANGWSPRAG
jgi:2-keto-3-deoxy-L-rhamnonate aldolase RhmA